jgi:hypothetical protein
MLNDDGSITFVPELLAAVDGFLIRYEERHGAAPSQLERALVVVYVLDVLRREAEEIADRVARSPAFSDSDPRELLVPRRGIDSGLPRGGPDDLAIQLVSRGWIPGDAAH